MKLVMERARPSWQSYEQVIITYPYKVHNDDGQDNNNIDATVFFVVYVFYQEQ